MASRPPESTSVYAGKDFAALVADLYKTCKYEIARAKGIMARLSKGGAKFDPVARQEYGADVSLVEKDMVDMAKVMKGIATQKPLSDPLIEKIYDKLCYSLAMLESVNSRWETVAASDFIEKAIATLKITNVMQANLVKSGKLIEKELKELSILLAKAEKAKLKTYFKVGIGYLVDVVMIVSPHARVLSAVSKFAVGTVVSIGSDLLLGKPQDLIGTAIGTTASGTQIEYAARGLDKGVIALDKAGKALKINSALSAIKDIKGARALIKEIEKKISSMKKSLTGQAKLLLKIKQVLEKNEIIMRKLIKKLQDNAAKFSAASDTFQKFKKLREQL